MRHLSIASFAAVLSLASPILAQPLNDSCESPEPISGLGIEVFFSTIGASTDGVGAPACNQFGFDQIANDVWYCWTADQTGPVILSLCGSTSLDTKIAVYQGCGPCPQAGGVLACNDDSCSLQSQVNWTATAGQSYLIRIGSYPGSAPVGEGTFRIESGILYGPVVNPATGRSYVLLHPSSWTAAQATAVAMGGNLATVRDADENEFIRSQIAGFDGLDRRLWIGLNDVASEGEFVWASGDDAPFRNWSGGEPNNTGGMEHYVELFGSNGLWNDNTDNPTFQVYGVVELAGAACPADWDNSGSVNSADISAYLSSWLSSLNNNDLSADFDNSGSVNSADISAFLSAWLNALNQGC